MRKCKAGGLTRDKRASAGGHALNRWFHALVTEYEERILIVDRKVAEEWGASQSEMKPNANVRDVVLEELSIRRGTVIELKHERDEAPRMTTRSRA